MQISIANLIGGSNSSIGYVKKLIKNFKARVLPNSIFEAEACLVATLRALNFIGLLRKTSLVITPNAYTEGILYDVIPNTTLGDMTVVRATTATRVNSAGLIEVVPRNLITYSEQIDNADWVKTNVTITANATNAPNGTLTAEKLIPTVTNDLHITESSVVPFVSGNSYTFSFYAKRAENNFIQITASSSLLSTRANFNLLNGTLGTVDSGITATITLIDNDWYRCTASFVASATGNFRMILSNITASTSARFATFAGNGTSGVFVWGCQIDNGSTATEYFPTTTRLNIPRIDYTNGSCPSLLVEPQRTNLLTYSNDFSNVIWAKVASSTVTTDSGVQNPSGVSPTFRFNASNLAFGGILRQILTLTVGQTYTFSYFAKKGNYRYVGIRFNNARNGERFPTYDFDTDTLNKQGATCDLSRTILTNGWVKLTITFTATIITSNCDIALTTSNGDTATALSGTEFMYVFGAQTELSSFGTSYIPTVVSTVTRNADVISKTGISSLIGQTEGTIFVEANLSVNANERRIITVSNGTESQRIMFWTDGTILYANFNNLSVTIGTFPIGIAKIALGYTISGGSTTYSIKLNNNTLITGTSATAPNPLSAINLGTTTGLGLILNDRINSVQLYKTRLTNSEITSLTAL